MVRKHKGIHQTGPNKGKLKKGYKYSGKKLKSGLSEIVKLSVQKGGETQPSVIPSTESTYEQLTPITALPAIGITYGDIIQNEGRNIIKAYYPNNTTVFFIGTNHDQNLLTDYNVDLIVKELETNSDAELWVEFYDNAPCNDIVNLFRTDINSKPMIYDLLTNNMINKLLQNNQGICSRPNMIQGWDTRYKLLITGIPGSQEYFNNTNAIHFMESIHYNISLNDLQKYFINKMPYIDIKEELQGMFNRLVKSLFKFSQDRDLNSRILRLKINAKQRVMLAKILYKIFDYFTWYSDEQVHNKLSLKQNKTIFIIQGFAHFNNFTKLFLPKYHIYYEHDKDELILD